MLYACLSRSDHQRCSKTASRQRDICTDGKTSTDFPVICLFSSRGYLQRADATLHVPQPPFSSSPQPHHMNALAELFVLGTAPLGDCDFSVGGFQWCSCILSQPLSTMRTAMSIISTCAVHQVSLVAIPLLSTAEPHEYPLPSCSFSARHLRVTVFCGRGFQTLPTATPCYIMLFRSWHFALDPLFSDLPRKASRQRGVCVWTI